MGRWLGANAAGWESGQDLDPCDQVGEIGQGGLEFVDLAFDGLLLKLACRIGKDWIPVPAAAALELMGEPAQGLQIVFCERFLHRLQTSQQPIHEQLNDLCEILVMLGELRVNGISYLSARSGHGEVFSACRLWWTKSLPADLAAVCTAAFAGTIST